MYLSFPISEMGIVIFPPHKLIAWVTWNETHKAIRAELGAVGTLYIFVNKPKPREGVVFSSNLL